MDSRRPSKQTSLVRSIVQMHYVEMANSARKFYKTLEPPREGWVRTIRKALEMSGPQLAARLKLSRNRVSVLERREVEGEITINQLKNMAEALDCEFTYAIVPRKDIDQIKRERAEEIALAIVNSSNQNMFLEGQSVAPEKQKFLLEQVTLELLREGSRALWKNE